jgi:hypothetical protein
VYLLAFSSMVLLGILIFKGLTARRRYKLFGVKGLRWVDSVIKYIIIKYKGMWQEGRITGDKAKLLLLLSAHFCNFKTKQ